MPSTLCRGCDTRFDPTLPACPACGEEPLRLDADAPPVGLAEMAARRKRLVRLGMAAGLVLGGLTNWAFFAIEGGGRHPWLAGVLLSALGLTAGAAFGLIASMVADLTPVKRYGDGTTRGPQNPFA